MTRRRLVRNLAICLAAVVATTLTVNAAVYFSFPGRVWGPSLVFAEEPSTSLQNWPVYHSTSPTGPALVPSSVFQSDAPLDPDVPVIGPRPSLRLEPVGVAALVHWARGGRSTWRAKFIDLFVYAELKPRYQQTSVREEIDGQVWYRFDRK